MNRLCHVDIGFAMKANETGITADDNASGNYCGTCHGVVSFPMMDCEHCH